MKYGTEEAADYVQKLEIRLKKEKEINRVEYFDGVRIDPNSVPDGKHLYHTRHSDTDLSQPKTILPEGKVCVVNFCGSIVTEQALTICEETKLMFVSWI